jgi:hypothetical protein
MIDTQRIRLQELRDRDDLTASDVIELGELEEVELEEKMEASPIVSVAGEIAADKLVDVAEKAEDDLEDAAERKALRIKEEAERVAEELKRTGVVN